MIETRQECEHTALWGDLHRAPKPGTRIYCRQCEDMRRVITVTGSWHGYCLSCAWRKTRMDVKKLAGQVREHIAKTGHVVNVRNHDGTQSFTARTPHAADNVGHHAESDGSHSASVAAMRRVLPPRRHENGSGDTLF